MNLYRFIFGVSPNPIDGNLAGHSLIYGATSAGKTAFGSTLIEQSTAAASNDRPEPDARTTHPSRLLVGLLVAAADLAHAGGMSNANSGLTTFNTALFTCIGTLAITYLGYEGVKCWTDHGNWIRDFGGACIKVAVVGAVAGVLGPYLWNFFTS
jgi:hypothetical protein